MALPPSGALSFSAIGAALCTPITAPYSLRAMSLAAGKTTPDSVSEFYGYSCPSYTISVFAQIQSFVSSPVAGFYYSINGGTAVFIINTTVPTSPSYGTVVSSLSVPIGSNIRFWVRNTANTANYTFGTGNNSGNYTSNCGQTAVPYIVTPSGTTSYYLNLRVVTSAFVTC